MLELLLIPEMQEKIKHLEMLTRHLSAEILLLKHGTKAATKAERVALESVTTWPCDCTSSEPQTCFSCRAKAAVFPEES